MANARENKQNIFLGIVGSSPELRILDFLLTFPDFDYSKVEIARNSEVSYTNMENILPKLLKSDLILRTRKIGKAELYKLNTNHPIVKRWTQLHWFIIKYVTQKEHKKIEIHA